jgi:hypothetical protein
MLLTNKIMRTSSNALYDIFENNGELVPSIMFDLFGFVNWTKEMIQNQNETITMFLGLYKGLYLMEVSYQEVERCFIRNKLDDLIHIKYSIHYNNYYSTFCEKKIKIGNTYYNLSENRQCDIFIYSQIQPPYHLATSLDSLDSLSNIIQYSFGSEDSIILHKINEYKRQDNINNRNHTSDYVTINDVKELLHKQDKKCYVCGDNVITREWQSNCLYQFTLDRIDNKLQHKKNNVLICCLYCNCFGHFDCDNQNKICENQCHQIKRNITRTKHDVPISEIKKLLLDV